MAKLEQYFSGERIRSVEAQAQRAVGRKFKVQESKHMHTEGIITAVRASHANFTASGRSVYMVFAVDMECGTNKVPRTFNIRGKDLPVQ